MKKEHYQHVQSTFKLDQYSEYNIWMENEHDERKSVSDLWVEPLGDVWIITTGQRYTGQLFVDLPSMELATEVLRYIQDSEILFV